MLVGEVFVMAGAFAVLFAILFCGMKPSRIRNKGKKCNKCNKCKNRKR